MAYHLKHKPEKWISNLRVLAIDHGTKTLGLAICNAYQTVVTPIETIRRKKWKDDSAELNQIIQENEIKAIVMGYPLNMDGSAGPRCQSVKDYVMLMEQTWSDLIFFFWDERLSTSALDDSVDNHVNKDSFSAKVILDEVLSWLKNIS
jgi:putative transcription antitermination factor YqgF